MKVITLITFLLSTSLFSQNLSIDELLKLRKNEVGFVEEYLTSKGWSFLEAKEPADGKMGRATFTYNKDRYSDSAESFIDFYYSGYSDTRKIGIQINRSEIYNQFLNRIKGFGCKLIESKVEDGEIIKLYSGQTTTFKVSTSTVESDFSARKTVYHILVYDNEY